MRGSVFLGNCIQMDLCVARNVKMCHNLLGKISFCLLLRNSDEFAAVVRGLEWLQSCKLNGYEPAYIG